MGINLPPISPDFPWATVQIRVRGIVQGVGFRPMVWRLAHQLGLVGKVYNDAEGVGITVSGNGQALSEFQQRLEQEAPPLSQVESIEVKLVTPAQRWESFEIVNSRGGENQTRIAPDTATCQACRAEIFDPRERRYGYAFTNCTHCGPRLSIMRGVPYDRHRTTMAEFPLCPECRLEYENPGDRRFHAQPIACPVCGPKLWLEPSTLGNSLDPIPATQRLLQEGKIIAIRGLGGFHLACDATNAVAVNRLRERKQRWGKPLALMARDITVIRRYCQVTPAEAAMLLSPAAPIVLLAVGEQERLPTAIAPNMRILGFMLPYTPVHILLLAQIDYPLVMTSGNLSDEPQIISNSEAREKLMGNLADGVLFHNREIANRLDDSIVRVMGGKPRLLRRARGYVPRAIPLPPGFEHSPEVLAYGGELKSTFCFIKNGAAILSQHQGDLENATTFEDYQHNLRLYQELFDYHPQVLVSDRHPHYLSTQLAQQHAICQGLPLISVQHHHAHIASCLVENGIPRHHPPVLGIALDGLGLGDDGTIWGGEFLLADYRHYQRLATFKPVPMIGGAQAIREPWRNTYAHLRLAFGWEKFQEEFGDLELAESLNQKPLKSFEIMLNRELNVPLASSCGRLFDAVAAALGWCRDRATFEGEGAIALEMAVNRDPTFPYPFDLVRQEERELIYIEPRPMWHALLTDLKQKTPVSVIATRFHQGLAQGITHLVQKLADQGEGNPRLFQQVVLSGGCFQNQVLWEQITTQLEQQGFECLSHSMVPANDGGLALGQGAIALSAVLDQPSRMAHS